jgi:hypothetical protein
VTSSHKKLKGSDEPNSAVVVGRSAQFSHDTDRRVTVLPYAIVRISSRRLALVPAIFHLAIVVGVVFTIAPSRFYFTFATCGCRKSCGGTCPTEANIASIVALCLGLLSIH